MNYQLDDDYYDITAFRNALRDLIAEHSRNPKDFNVLLYNCHTWVDKILEEATTRRISFI